MMFIRKVSALWLIVFIGLGSKGMWKWLRKAEEGKCQLRQSLIERGLNFEEKY